MDQIPSPPPAGQVSADGMFRWDGTAWVPVGAGERVATGWTRPMQQATAAYLVLTTLVSVAITFAFVNQQAMIRVMQSQPSNSSLPPGQLDRVVGVAVGFTIGVAVFFALVYLFLALGSFLGWTWIFYADLVIFGFATISELLAVIGLTSPSRQIFPLWTRLLQAVIGLGAPALFTWLLIGLIRFGAWAKARPGWA